MSCLQKCSIALLVLAALNEAAAQQACSPGTFYDNLFFGCQNCPPGHYQDKPGQTSCKKCPDGYYCPDKKNPPKLCPPGSFSSESFYLREKCETCSNGYYQDKPGQIRCMTCPDGYSCPLPKTRAIPCRPGTVSADSIYMRLTCKSCTNGYYQDKWGQRACRMCPDGHRCPIPRDRAIPCAPGTASWVYINQRLTCQDCSSGYYQDKPGQMNCVICPDGHSCPVPSNRPIPCPPGTASVSYINRRITCENCSNGYYQDKPGQAACLVCPTGYSCPIPRTKAILCPQGTTSSSYISARTSCSKCSAGRCLSPVTPVVCQAGKYLAYSFYDPSSCRACGTGQYQAESGQNNCQVCPAGFFCSNSSGKPIPCPSGTYRTIYMSGSACRPCSTGMYQAQEGQTSCLVCPAGHFCENPKLEPVPCPAGSYASYTGKTSCQPCSSQQYQDKTGQQQCKMCPAGYFCSKPDIRPQQCLPNTFRYESSADRSRCPQCPAGQYQDQCGQARCKAVPDGGSSPVGISNAKCDSLSVSEHDLDECSNAYSNAPVQEVVGNKGVRYKVFNILPEHLPGQIFDDKIEVNTAKVFAQMACAARADGVKITISSGFRNYERQVYLYNCYKNKTLGCNNGQLAARPGTSNHGAGVALDLGTICNIKQIGDQPPPACASSKVYIWLKKNGHTFRFNRTVRSEPWHWKLEKGPVPGPTSFT